MLSNLDIQKRLFHRGLTSTVPVSLCKFAPSKSKFFYFNHGLMSALYIRGGNRQCGYLVTAGFISGDAFPSLDIGQVHFRRSFLVWLSCLNLEWHGMTMIETQWRHPAQDVGALSYCRPIICRKSLLLKAIASKTALIDGWN